MPTIEHLISLNNISFSYGDNNILEDISIDIHSGDFVGILGPNGSGKTTLLKIILGLIPPTKGEVKLFEKPLNKFTDWQKIGFVPQKATQFDAKFPITVEEVVSLGRISLRGIGVPLNSSDTEEVINALKIVDMASFAKSQISQLSGGQQQRVFIAKALVSHPKILILDEPTVGIDSASEDSFYLLLKELNHQGITLLLVSHDTETVMKEVNKVICLNRTLCFHGAPHEFSKSAIFGQMFGDNKKFVHHQH